MKERPFLFCSGNHDFINPEKQLRAAGIKCWSLDDKLIEFEGFTFYGFPYVPPIAGGWMFESNKIEMQKHFEVMDKVVENSGKKLDILVAHCPPWGYLDDWGGHNIGNSVLTDRLSYEDNDFSYLLCGHNHDSNCRGKTILFGDVLISNAATTFNVIEIKEKKNGNQENS